MPYFLPTAIFPGDSLRPTLWPWFILLQLYECISKGTDSMTQAWVQLVSTSFTRQSFLARDSNSCSLSLLNTAFHASTVLVIELEQRSYDFFYVSVCSALKIFLSHLFRMFLFPGLLLVTCLAVCTLTELFSMWNLTRVEVQLCNMLSPEAPQLSLASYNWCLVSISDSRCVPVVVCCEGFM